MALNACIILIPASKKVDSSMGPAIKMKASERKGRSLAKKDQESRTNRVAAEGIAAAAPAAARGARRVAVVHLLSPPPPLPPPLHWPLRRRNHCLFFLLLHHAPKRKPGSTAATPHYILPEILKKKYLLGAQLAQSPSPAHDERRVWQRGQHEVLPFNRGRWGGLRRGGRNGNGISRRETDTGCGEVR